MKFSVKDRKGNVILLQRDDRITKKVQIANLCVQVHLGISFKGVLHLLPQKAPKLACFVLYLKIIYIFLKKIIYASYSKLSKKLKNSTKIKVGQAILELLIQEQHFDCFDLSFKNAWPNKISMPFLSSLNIFFYTMHNSFFKKLLIILR